MIIVNLEKAKEITKERLRKEREPLFKALDLAYLQYLEDKSDCTDIIDEKNRLRNITKLADEASSLEELKAIKVK